MGCSKQESRPWASWPPPATSTEFENYLPVPPVEHTMFTLECSGNMTTSKTLDVVNVNAVACFVDEILKAKGPGRIREDCNFEHEFDLVHLSTGFVDSRQVHWQFQPKFSDASILCDFSWALWPRSCQAPLGCFAVAVLHLAWEDARGRQ